MLVKYRKTLNIWAIVNRLLHEVRLREISEIQFFGNRSLPGSGITFELITCLDVNDFVQERLCDRAEVFRNERERSKGDLSFLVGSRVEGVRNGGCEDVAKEFGRECRERSRKRRIVD
jgi:hypothetical protein